MIRVFPVASFSNSFAERSTALTSGALFLSTASRNEAASFVSYLERHIAESGTPGMPRFAFPVEIRREELEKAFSERWTRPVDQPKWGRTWLLWNPADMLVVGHLDLRGAKAAHSLHRAELSMGLLHAYTRQGFGAILIEQALGWCRNERTLEWLDLGVFADNEPARKLYRRLGFDEVGHRSDAFRFEDGSSVDAIYMAKRLR